MDGWVTRNEFLMHSADIEDTTLKSLEGLVDELLATTGTSRLNLRLFHALMNKIFSLRGDPFMSLRRYHQSASDKADTDASAALSPASPVAGGS
jgi:hypothetical protein